MAYLCFDIGGLSLKYSLYSSESVEIINGDFKYKLIKRKLIFDKIKYIFFDLEKKYNIVSIGISSSGIIDIDNNNFRLLVNRKTKIDSIQKYMEWCKIPWIIENDANSALIAELSVLDIKIKNVIMFTIGTALGGSIAINRKIYYGSNFMSNEVGCGNIINNNIDNISVQTGMNGMVEEYNLIMNSNLDGKQIVENAKKNDKIAYSMLDKRWKVISNIVSNLILFLDPDIVIFGGGVSNNKWYMRNLFKRIKDAHSNTGVKLYAKLKSAHFYNDAGKIGILHKLIEKHK